MVAPRRGGPAHYEVELLPTDLGDDVDKARKLISHSLSLTARGLRPAHAVAIRVRAVNAAGPGPYSEALTVYTHMMSLPKAPLPPRFEASPDCTSIALEVVSIEEGGDAENVCDGAERFTLQLR